MRICADIILVCVAVLYDRHVTVYALNIAEQNRIRDILYAQGIGQITSHIPISAAWIRVGRRELVDVPASVQIKGCANKRVPGIAVTALYIPVLIWRRLRNIARKDKRVRLPHEKIKLLRLTRIPHKIERGQAVAWSRWSCTAVASMLKLESEDLGHVVSCRSILRVGRHIEAQNRKVDDICYVRSFPLLSVVTVLHI